MELFKYGGNELKRRMLELFSTIYSKKKIPQDWETGLAINIHKKAQKITVEIIEE